MDKVIYVNPQYTVSENENAIAESGIKGNGLLWSGNNITQSWKILTQDWFSGPVLSLIMDCKNCYTPAIGDKLASDENPSINRTEII